MDLNAIQIAVRLRPWNEKEIPCVTQQTIEPMFLGDGNFAASPRKPANSGSIRQVIDVVDNRMLDFDKPDHTSTVRRGQPGAKRHKDRRYLFDHAMGMATTQEEVFEKTALPLLDGVMTGFNATVFAYGATGCGKTHTISGSAEQPGVIIRTTAELFRRIDESKDEYDTFLELSMVEIYNETIRDLLADDYPACPVGGLKLLENEKERVTVGNVKLHRPTTVDEVMDLVLLGNTRRSTSSTAMNSVSSRSHAVLQINVGRNSKGHDVNVAESVVRQCMTSATLSIIDLAGSERAAATRNMGDRMKEGANINKSLLSLSSCITALCQRPVRGQKVHVPYRNSKLTRMLKFSLGGNCRTVMIVCISPSSKDIEDTHNTLVWADRAKNVSTKISRNTAGVDLRVQQYLEAIQSKQQEIDRLNNIIRNSKAYDTGRREKDKEDMRRAVDGLNVLFKTAIGVIANGAGKRAGYDASEMTVNALKGKMSEVQRDEDRLMIDNLMKQQDQRYKNNAEAVNAMQAETSSKTSIEGSLKALESRRFGDAVDSSDLDNVKLNVMIKRMEMQTKIMEARENAYREVIQDQANAMALAAIGIMAMKDHGEDLKALSDLCQKTLLNLFRSSSGGMLPPTPLAPTLGQPTRPHHDIFSSDPEKSLSPILPSSSKLPAPRARNSLGPKANSSFGLKSALRASPAIRRVMASRSSIMSPGRQTRVSSPAKKISRISLGPSARTKPVKKARWKDEAGEGSLEQMKIMTSDSDSGNQIFNGNEADESGEWEDQDQVTELPTIKSTKIQSISRISLPKARSSLAPLPSVPAIQPSSTTRSLGIGLPRTRNSPPSDSSSSGNENIIPAWKANRKALKTQAQWIQNLSQIDSDTSNQSISSPESGSKALSSLSTSSSGLGGPSRIPLNERRSVPGGNSSFALPSTTGSTGLSSNLHKPTQSSLGRAAGKSIDISLSVPSTASNVGVGSGTTGPRPSMMGSTRRVSSIGPQRSERSKARVSTAPGMVNDPNQSTSIPSGMTSTVISAPSLNHNPLAGGAKRMLTADTAATLNRRNSVMDFQSKMNVGGNGNGSMRGPRPSVSMAQIPKARSSILPGRNEGLFR